MCNDRCTCIEHAKDCTGRNCPECWINYCVYDEEVCPVRDKIMDERKK